GPVQRHGTRRRTSRDRRSRVYEHLVSRAGVDERDLDRAALAFGALAECEAALLVHLAHAHRDGNVATGDARARGAVGHSISDPFSSSSSCTYSAPIPLSSSSVAAASSSSTCESAKPTWMRTQSP